MCRQELISLLTFAYGVLSFRQHSLFGYSNQNLGAMNVPLVHFLCM